LYDCVFGYLKKQWLQVSADQSEHKLAQSEKQKQKAKVLIVLDRSYWGYCL